MRNPVLEELAVRIAGEPAFIDVVNSTGYQSRALLGQTCGFDEQQFLEFGQAWARLFENVFTEADLRYTFSVAGLDYAVFSDLVTRSRAAEEVLTGKYPELAALSASDVSEVLASAGLISHGLAFFAGACNVDEMHAPKLLDEKNVMRWLSCLNRAEAQLKKCLGRSTRPGSDAVTRCMSRYSSSLVLCAKIKPH
jgi:hypothetical protein